jgi:hypothetical protein
MIDLSDKSKIAAPKSIIARDLPSASSFLNERIREPIPQTPRTAPMYPKILNTKPMIVLIAVSATVESTGAAKSIGQAIAKMQDTTNATARTFFIFDIRNQSFLKSLKK